MRAADPVPFGGLRGQVCAPDADLRTSSTRRDRGGTTRWARFAACADQGEMSAMTMVPLNVSAIDRYLEAHVGARRHRPPLHRRRTAARAGRRPADPAARRDGRCGAEETRAAHPLACSPTTSARSSAARRRSTSRSRGTDQTRFRGNVYYQQGTLAMALRAIPYRIPTFEELGLPPVMEHFANLPQGLVLVHRAHRFREVDDPGVGDRLHQRAPASATSSRSRTRSSTCTTTSARR